MEWFGERADRIILLFDAHKLDISDEFKRCIEALAGVRTPRASDKVLLRAGNEDKIRIVLNKADMVDSQQLMRVYGALMWSLGKVCYNCVFSAGEKNHVLGVQDARGGARVYRLLLG